MLSKLGLIFILFFFLISPVYADFYDASTVYEKLLKKESSGVYYRNNYVFVIADIEIKDTRARRFYYEGKAMLKTLQLLKAHITSEISKFYGSDHEKDDKKNKIQLMDLKISKIRARILINRKSGNYYRRVSLFDPALIERIVRRAIRQLNYK